MERRFSPPRWLFILLIIWTGVTFAAALLHVANWLTFAGSALLLLGFVAQYLWDRRHDNKA